MQSKTPFVLLAAFALAAASALPAAKKNEDKNAQKAERSEQQAQRQARKENPVLNGNQARQLEKPPEIPAAPSLKISPTKEIHLRPGKTASVKVPSQKSTPARNWSSDPSVAVFENNTVRALSPGRALLSVVLDGHYATLPVLVSQPLPAPFPQTDDSHPIDAIVNKNLRELGILPSPLCTDQEFLRRACLDLMGALPDAAQTRAFLASTSPSKRADLVEWIFRQEAYADYWANKWADLLRVKAEFPSNLWPNAVQAYHAWLRSAVVTNKPLNKIARELLNTAGSNFRDPAANFYRAFQKRTPAAIAESVALIFMGTRFSCTECTTHPYQTWSRPWLDAFASFFTCVRYKKTDEWKEEIVYFSKWAPYKSPITKAFVPPWLPKDNAFVPEIIPIKFNANANSREIFLQWLTASDNPFFARHAANRYWAALFGRGITNPVDDVRPSNPPSNPELLDLLAKHLTDSKYDLRELLRFIVSSQTYQRSSETNASNKNDFQNFSHYVIRRLDAEVIADSIGAVTGVYESFSSRTPEPLAYWPNDFHSMRNPDGSVTTAFLENFGRPSRDTSLANERDRSPSLSQSLYLLSSDQFVKKIASGKGSLGAATSKFAKDPARLVDECYLSILNRPPTDAEKQKLETYYAQKKNNIQATRDLAWALFNTKEFLYNH